MLSLAVISTPNWGPLNWFGWFLVALYSFSVVFSILRIGKSRDPYTSGDAVWALGTAVVVIGGLFLFGVGA